MARFNADLTVPAWKAGRSRHMCQRSRLLGRLARLPLLSCLPLASLSLMGCSNDLNSWWDPSTVGRWEYTPTVAPILERIDIIEQETDVYVDTTEIMPEDLIPEALEYEFQPGDQLLVEIFDFLAPGVPSQYQRVIDARGNLDLPQIGRVNTTGMTPKQVEERLVELLRERGIIRQDALVTVQPISQRDSTYAVLGAVARVGRFVIPGPNYRLLDALTEAGGIPPSTPEIFIIRQALLTDEASRGVGVEPGQTAPPAEPPATPKDGTNLENLIERLTEPTPPGAPSAFSSDGQQGAQSVALRNQPTLIDLPESRPARNPEQAVGAQSDLTQGQWVFLNGEWVRVAARASNASDASSLAEGPDPLSNAATAASLVTQRVIRVPMKPLLQGNAAFNIVIRPGDVLHVPSPVQGFVYIGGRGIARPGTFNLPALGKLTLTKGIMAAGGLSPIGIPDRTDLTRMVGPNRQATIRMNLQAIFEGSEPDVFLKPDDVINVGTTWWAQPLAVVRNGFRMTYGFGFLLDRNFGNDVFGAPPSNFNN